MADITVCQKETMYQKCTPLTHRLSSTRKDTGWADYPEGLYITPRNYFTTVSYNLYLSLSQQIFI